MYIWVLLIYQIDQSILIDYEKLHITWLTRAILWDCSTQYHFIIRFRISMAERINSFRINGTTNEVIISINQAFLTLPDEIMFLFSF